MPSEWGNITSSRTSRREPRPTALNEDRKSPKPSTVRQAAPWKALMPRTSIPSGAQPVPVQPVPEDGQLPHAGPGQPPRLEARDERPRVEGREDAGLLERGHAIAHEAPQGTTHPTLHGQDEAALRPPGDGAGQEVARRPLQQRLVAPRS